VEYSLILVLIAVVAAIALLVVGHTTNNLFFNISSALGT
jgi:Flp pilus assembly pilin Flp